jgi:hypothetical protein
MVFFTLKAFYKHLSIPEFDLHPPQSNIYYLQMNSEWPNQGGAFIKEMIVINDMRESRVDHNSVGPLCCAHSRIAAGHIH